MQAGFLKQLQRDLEAPIEVRRLGTGWFSGFFAIVLATVGLCFVAALRWPAMFAMPDGLVYIYASLVHANLGGDFDWLGKWLVVPRFHHWHHAIEAEGVDKNFAIHFPIIDRIFGTYYLPKAKWPSGYGVPETVPSGYLAQMKYPFVRKQA